ncbi:MAG: Hsp20/alpha crystallin family protein [Burkholderiaceae bacterium]|nr:Hsp20/alpha crystallin family protein [Burkholderiaceae bacterium]
MHDSFVTLTRSLPGDLDRVRADLDAIFGRRPSQRLASPVSRGAFPAINVRQNAQAIDIQVFAPGIDASRTEVTLDRGMLTIVGERASSLPARPDTDTECGAEPTSVRSNERYAGRFRRAVTLPDDADPNQVTANYRDGVLHINVQRRIATPPTRIAIG